MKSWSDFKLLLNFESTSFIRSLFESLIFAIFGWIPGIIGFFLRSFIYKLVIKGKGLLNIEESVVFKRPKDIILGKDVYIDHNVYIHGMPGKVKIGDNTAIMHNAEIHPYQIYVPLGKNESKKYYFLENSFVEIGKNVLVGSMSVITGQGGTKIGDNILIGPNVIISPINHSFKKGELIKNQKPVCKGIVIEDDVWIGAGAIILDGVRIGKGSVIGAGSVVTKSIPPYSVAVGVPARVIKKRI